MNRTHAIWMLACVGFALSWSSNAQTTASPIAPATSTQAAKPYSFTIRPVVIDTASAAQSALGLDYDFTGKYEFWTTRTGAGSDTIDPSILDKTFRAGQLDLRARGTLAASKEKVPNKLLDFAGNAVLKLDAPSYFAKLGGSLKFETDQSGDSKQTMAGLTGSISRVGTIVAGDAGSLLVSYGTVDPSKDADRKQLVGQLKNFRRWEAELSYSIPIRSQQIRSVDFDYRHYQEVNAPRQIRAADRDRNRLGLVRINLDKDFFLQYSRGSLPFDQKVERAVKIGWSAKLE
jgi:hypothetical protein